MIEELSPSAEEHGEVEFVGNDDIAIQFGDGFAEKSGIGQVEKRLAFSIFVASRSSPGDVGVGFSPITVFQVVAASVDGPDDRGQFEQSLDIDLVGLIVLLDEDCSREEEHG